MTRGFLIAVISSLPGVAQAWPMSPASAPEPEPEPIPAAPIPEPTPAPPTAPSSDVPTPDEMADWLEDLEKRTKIVEKQQRGAESTKEHVEKLLPFSGSAVITAFVDVGAFAVAGNGAGIRSDFLHQQYPKYRDSVSGQWVFMGDPFTTMINSLGDPADTADSREVENDVINSSGRPSVIVNSIGLAIGKGFDLNGDGVQNDVAISVLAQLLPRPGPDSVEVSFAQITYRPTIKFMDKKQDFTIDVGKIESVLGVEYRRQDAHRRLGVTPSLICRYTCGRPIGIDARYVGERLYASAAIINGDNFEERFAPDAELRANKAPSVAGHLELRLPVFDEDPEGDRYDQPMLKVGVSGAFGPQDGQSNLGVQQWHYGFDLSLENLRGWEATAEFVQGRQQGASVGNLAQDRMDGIARAGCDAAPCLDYKGAYLLVSRRFGRFTPYVRADWRDATHQNGAEFVYEARSVRGTFGFNFKVNSHIQAKVEYNWNHELGVPRFPHDVITSSIVVRTND